MMHYRHKNVKNRISIRYLSVLLACTLLSGCGVTTVTPAGTTVVDEGLTFGMEPVFDYVLPQETPNVQVDATGYLPESTKIAIFEGSTLEKKEPVKYVIRDKESREVVYEGILQQKQQEGSTTYYGTFTEFQTPGEYYIECEELGCSYYFSIGENVYFPVGLTLKERIKISRMGTENTEKSYFTNGWRMDEHGNRDTRKACEALSYLLLGYEIYPLLYEQLWSVETVDDTINCEQGKVNFFAELRYETDWLLSMQDSTSGGIYAGIRSKNDGAEATFATEAEEYILREISEDATACFAATMAKYGYLYQQIDKEYATVCLKAAAKAWKYLETQASAKPEQMLYVAAELYRASSDWQYNAYITKNQEAILRGNDDFSLLMGEITYISTRRKVDKDLCGKMMTSLMEKAEMIATASRQGDYLVEEEQDEFMYNMTVMSVVDYIVTNHEYYTVIENHIHYLLGRNPKGVCAVDTMDILDSTRMLLYISSITAEKELILSE
ncbi:MAG: hypothetical protein E7299_09340 [Lachnospiraceae bacterium]|nr:hypothetical protein [Lachnospiraceae bacterium]